MTETFIIFGPGNIPGYYSGRIWNWCRGGMPRNVIRSKKQAGKQARKPEQDRNRAGKGCQDRIRAGVGTSTTSTRKKAL